MAGYVAENLLTGKVAFSSWDALDKRDGAVVLDVRETMERQAFELPDSVHIPLGQLRERIGELVFGSYLEINYLCIKSQREINPDYYK